MIGVPIISNELVIERVRDRKQVYRFVFDIEQIPEDELAWIIRQYRLAKKLVRRAKNPDQIPVDLVRELVRESDRILAKGYRGDPGRIMNPFLLDPALAVATHILVQAYSSADIGTWWCDRSNKGKLFTSTLCRDPALDIEAYGRRAIALNPWSLSNMGDLDTIIDSGGYHKSGTIGTSPFSFTRSVSPTSGVLVGTFTAANTTTIYSVILLIPSDSLPNYSSGCGVYVPAPPGTCNDAYYESVYLPLWGWDVSTTVLAGEVYSVKIRFYV